MPIALLLVIVFAQPCFAQVRWHSERSGVAVMVDVRTRRVLFAHGLREAAQHPTYPGSTLKPILLLHLLRQHRIDPTMRIACTRSQRVRGVLMKCAHDADQTSFDSEEALVWSCNTYFAKAATLFHEGEMEQTLRDYGLASETGWAKEEVRGEIPLAHDVEDREAMALGLGERVTPLEMLEGYRRLALQLDVDSAGKLVRDALAQTVDRGMARAAHSDAMKISGKTGTAVDRGESIGWFVGWADGKALVVRLEGGRGQDAAAVAKELFEAAR